MGRWLDIDSPIMRALSRVGDLLILNFLVFICCIPVVTVGAANTAMHYVILKMVRDKEGYLIRGFFKSFVLNFRQATLIWLLMLLVIAVYVGDVMIFNYSGIVFPKAVVIAVLAIAILLLMMAVYVFPLQARFENKIINTLKNAMMLALINLPKTILMLACYILPLVICYYFSYALLFIILFGFSGPAYGAACIYSEIFKKLEPELEEPADDMSFSIQMDEENGEADG